MKKISISTDGKPDQEIELNNNDVLIGRHKDCDLILHDGLASGHHARFHREGAEWTLTDLNSTNGTSLNNQPLTSAVLKHGDVITVGGVKIVFSDDGPADIPLKSVGANINLGRPPQEANTSAADVALVEQMRTHTDAIRREVAKVIVGQREVLDQVLMCMIAGGHALLVGLPGMAKTLMVSTIAKVLDMHFKRIQFTPDLMPTDITGTEILETNRETSEKEFRFVRGPIFCNLLLADEINRTPPKTQAALLEAMQEKRVTVGNTTYNLDAPFFVLATQNPIEQEGTYPLPEAQMDRFMFNVWVDYPQEHEEEQVVANTTVSSMEQPGKVLSKEQVIQLQQVVRKIPVSEHIIKYAIHLVRASRPGNEVVPPFVKEYVHVGAGPRAGQFLILAAKAKAVLEGRIHVSCKDIKSAAIPVMRHRIYTNFAADSEGLTSIDIIKKLLEAVEEPDEKDYS